ncbi:MAG: glutamine--tRNA ligase, partial [Verrucomicrobiia bacterium]
VSADHAVDAEVRLYDRLFTEAEPEAEGDFIDCLNPNSLKIITGKLEPSLADLPVGQRVQFERLGYFTPDPKDSAEGQLVFNRIVALRDSWAKQARK